MRWYIETRYWSMPKGEWMRLYRYKNRKQALLKMEHLIRVAILYNNRESIRLIEQRK